MRKWWRPPGFKARIACVCAALVVLAGLLRLVAPSDLRPSHRPAAWTHDAYIWQMQWKNSLRTAIQNNRDVVHAWRVLFADVHADGSHSVPQIDTATLRASMVPVVVVVRIEGQLDRFDASALQRQALAALAQARAGGLSVSALEIDHDCATAKLPRYALFLQALRHALQGQTTLSITALPAWLGSPDLPDLLAQTDTSVLQVHSVQNPSRGLFHTPTALGWVQQYNAISPTPFRVALPTYGSKVHFDRFGNYTLVENETPGLKGQGSGTELIVLPNEVAAFLATPALTSLTQLDGFAWFRLPTADDQRAWHTNTWRALVSGSPLQAQLAISAQPTAQAGLFDIVLRNTGSTDLAWPLRIALPGNCTDLDGSQGYEAVAPALGGPHFQTRQARLLAPQHKALVGWARCATSPEKELHATL